MSLDPDELFEIAGREAHAERSTTELTWPGKHRLETLRYRAARHEESHGAALHDWRNQLYFGDNLDVMGHLLREHRGKVDLIYIDPPFASNADYAKTIRRRGKQASPRFQEKQYGDVWRTDSYLQFMLERLTVMRELLSETGSLFLHCDWHSSGHLRCLLDEAFGPECFRNELIWHYYNKLQGNVGRFAANHDTIFFYSKSSSFTFHRLRERREKPMKQIKRVWNREKGSIVNAKDEHGHVLYVESTHKTLDDVWRLPMLQPADKVEAVGYPTQKPEALLERIIASASNPGDLVFDAFMGSGTALAVAAKLGRRCIGADVNLGAIHAATRRLDAIAKASSDGAPLDIKNGLADEGSEALEVYGGVDVFSVASPEREADGPPRERAEADISATAEKLVIRSFRPPRLLGRLSTDTYEADWRELVDSVLIDFHFDGVILRPSLSDVPERGELVLGSYDVPQNASRIRIKITDVLSDVYEESVALEQPISG